jgi:hypothetical protein
MFDAYQEHLESQPSSQSEWDSADARQRGEENPDAAWVLTDRDVWHRNPFYTDPPVPHPEGDRDLCFADEPVMTPFLVQEEEVDDDLPF